MKWIISLLLLSMLILAGCAQSELPPEPNAPGATGNYYKSIGEWATESDTFWLDFDETIECSLGETVDLTFKVDNDDFVYRNFYIWWDANNEWGVTNFEQNPIGQNVWIRGDANNTYSKSCDELLNFADENGEIFAVAYSCSFVQGAWDCNNNKWQLQVFSVSEIPKNSCEDTDGDDIYTKGTITGMINGDPYDYEDSCEGGSVIEYSCDPQDNSYATTTLDCEFGCYDGACLTLDAPGGPTDLKTSSDVDSPAEPSVGNDGSLAPPSSDDSVDDSVDDSEVELVDYDPYVEDGTVFCKGSQVGSTFSLNGRAYTVVDDESIRELDPKTDDYTKLCTSHVTNMSKLFNWALKFNQPLNSWDVSSVTNMSSMFEGARAFNRPLDNWDVSSVTDMSQMFFYTNSFNQPLDAWDVSSVTDMSGMFRAALLFNQPLDSWDVSSVRDMNLMFERALLFNQPLNSWNVSNLIDTRQMFSFALEFNQPLNSWDVSSVKYMARMFVNMHTIHKLKFKQDISSWNVDSVTDITTYQDASKFYTFSETLGPDFNLDTGASKKINFSVENFGSYKYTSHTSVVLELDAEKILGFNAVYDNKYLIHTVAEVEPWVSTTLRRVSSSFREIGSNTIKVEYYDVPSTKYTKGFRYSWPTHNNISIMVMSKPGNYGQRPAIPNAFLAEVLKRYPSLYE